MCVICRELFGKVLLDDKKNILLKTPKEGIVNELERTSRLGTFLFPGMFDGELAGKEVFVVVIVNHLKSLRNFTITFELFSILGVFINYKYFHKLLNLMQLQLCRALIKKLGMFCNFLSNSENIFCIILNIMNIFKYFTNCSVAKLCIALVMKLGIFYSF